MGVHTYIMSEITSPVAPNRLFQAIVLDNHNYAKNLPEFIKNVEFVEGDSVAVGCVTKVHFPEASPVKYVKNKVDEIDVEKCYIKYTTFEGDALGDDLECAVYENKFEPAGTGSKCTMIAHYHTKGDSPVKEGAIAAAKESITKMFKAVEAHLIANPHVYA